MRRFLLAAVLLVSLGRKAAGAEVPRWSGPVRTGTILVGQQELFSYELRETSPQRLPIVRELIVCRHRGERFRMVLTRRKSDFSLEMGYHSRTRPVEADVFVGPVPTRDAEIPRDPGDGSKFILPLTRLRAGQEELDFAVSDLLVPTVQRWLEETWRGTTPDIRQALSDVLVTSRMVPFGMGEDLTLLLGLVPATELKAYLQETRFRREDRGPDACAEP